MAKIEDGAGDALPAVGPAQERRSLSIEELAAHAERVRETAEMLHRAIVKAQPSENVAPGGAPSATEPYQRVLYHLERAHLNPMRVSESRARHGVLDVAKKEKQARTEEKLRAVREIIDSMSIKDPHGQVARITITTYDDDGEPITVEVTPERLMEIAESER